MTNQLRRTPSASTLHPAQGGFTLIEMLTALLVVAVLAAVAIPSYQMQLQKARRAEARSGLLRAAHWLEREAASRGLYSDGELPQGLATSDNGHYRIVRKPPRDENDARIHFQLEAIPQGAQASDTCGRFTLSHTGERGISSRDHSAAECWTR